MFKNLWNSLVSLVKRVITYFFPEHPELVEEIKGDEELVEEIDPDELNPSMEIMDVKEASTVIVDNESGERVTRIYTAGEETREIYQPENTKDFNANFIYGNARDTIINNNCYENEMNILTTTDVRDYSKYKVEHVKYLNSKDDIAHIYNVSTRELLEISNWSTGELIYRIDGFNPSTTKGFIKI